MSGAIVVPEVFKLLFKDRDFNEIPFDTKVVKDKIVLLSKRKSNFVSHSLYEKQRQLCGIAFNFVNTWQVLQRKKGRDLQRFSVNEILYENGRVVGAKTIDTGVDGLGIRCLIFKKGQKY